MHLNVLYFAHVRERVGKRAEVIELPDTATVADAVAWLTERYPALAGLTHAVRFAVDGEFVSVEAPLHDGAELVLIPPVAGGSGVEPVALTEAPLTDETVAALSAYVGDDRHGAIATFVGAVRDHARGRAVTKLEYEAYGSMAVRQMRTLVAEVESAFPGTRVAVHHRVGVLDIGDVAVIIAAGSAHRGAAFDACRRLIDRLKEDVPIWKKETGPDGTEWVSDRP